MPLTTTQETIATSGATVDFDKMLGDIDLGFGSDPELEEIISAADQGDLEDSGAVEEQEEEQEEEEEEEMEELVSAPTSVLEDEEMRDLDISLERAEAYEEQESAVVESVTPRAAGAEKKKTPRKAGAPRTPKSLDTIAPELFVLSGDIAALDDTAREATKVETLALKPTQVKVAEKFEKMFLSLSENKLPCRYTMIPFTVLDKAGAITSAEIIGAYKAAGLGEGTARSQSGQIMNLFNALCIADRAGSTLTLRADSNLAQRIRELSVAAA